MTQVDNYRVFSPVVRGSGAAVVHEQLARGLTGYAFETYSPRWEYFPFAMPYLFKGYKADIIHTSVDYAHFFRRPGKPLVATFHGFALDNFMKPYSSVLQRLHYATDLRYFTRLALVQAHTVTAVSQYVADRVVEELGYGKPIQVIHNGVDIESFTPRHHSVVREIKVLFSGNLTRHKGADVLVEIARLLRPGIKIYYTRGLRSKGTLPDLPQLESLGSVAHEHMPRCYQQSDILVTPSVREGFGLGAAEAMACGLPVVATDGSSLKELVVEGKGGFLCKLGDFRAFAARINQLAENPVLRKEMGEYNRQRAESLFSLAATLKQYRELFDKVRETTL
ncbi:MAG TPA: glycosyltransferase family 4 protein [Gammaproteobacteria bacterium]|nr:glycosyltransferase family 4 protein [Gammaproteobacteria bacterium]